MLPSDFPSVASLNLSDQTWNCGTAVAKSMISRVLSGSSTAARAHTRRLTASALVRGRNIMSGGPTRFPKHHRGRRWRDERFGEIIQRSWILPIHTSPVGHCSFLELLLGEW